MIHRRLVWLAISAGVVLALSSMGYVVAQMSKSDVVASLAPGANDGFAVELEGASLSLSRRVHSLHGERARGNQWCLLAALALPGSGCHEVASNRHPSHICQQRH